MKHSHPVWDNLNRKLRGPKGHSFLCAMQGRQPTFSCAVLSEVITSAVFQNNSFRPVEADGGLDVELTTIQDPLPDEARVGALI